MTSDLSSPRIPIYTPSGDILISETGINRISCLLDNDNDGYPDERVTFANESNGLSYPFGMAFADGYFYVGNTSETRRYPWASGNRSITDMGEAVMTYPAFGHVTRSLIISPDNSQLYVTIGSDSNVDEEPLPRASAQRANANLNGTNRTTFTFGVRNTVGLAFHPVTDDLYASVQE
jgi:glucose/arabinose dehydrogenase